MIGYTLLPNELLAGVVYPDWGLLDRTSTIMINRNMRTYIFVSCFCRLVGKSSEKIKISEEMIQFTAIRLGSCLMFFHHYR